MHNTLDIRNTTKKNHFRGFARLLVLFLVGIAFFINANRQITFIVDNENDAIDYTNTLPDGSVALLSIYQKNFKEAYDITLLIKILPASMEKEYTTPQSTSNFISIVLCPDNKTVTITTTPLLKAALDSSFIDSLATEHISPAYESDSWADGLSSALNTLNSRLLEIIPPQS